MQLPVLSQLRQPVLQFLVGQFPALRPRHQALCRRHCGIPLVCAYFASLLPGFQAVIGPVIFLLGRSPILFPLGFLAVGSYFPAGALGLAGSNIVAVAGIIARRQQKVPPAVMAAARRVPHSKPPIKFDLQKIRQAVEYSFLRDKNSILLGGVHHGYKAHLHGKALLKVLVE